MASGGVSPAPSVLGVDISQPIKGLSNLNPNSSSNGVPKTTICVFCGASPGRSPAHLEAARSLAKVFHDQNIKLVFGGGNAGVMGEVARTLVKLSGPEAVHGIIPHALVKYERKGTLATSDSTNYECGPGGQMLPIYAEYGTTTVVKDMHTRKHLMASEVLAGGPGSGFIALSGGYGTLEELMEVVTWNQLGIHNRGVVVYNVEGYWDGLLDWVRGSVDAGFVGEGNKDIIVEAKDAADAVKALRDYKVAAGQFKLSWGNQ